MSKKCGRIRWWDFNKRCCHCHLGRVFLMWIQSFKLLYYTIEFMYIHIQYRYYVNEILLKFSIYKFIYIICIIPLYTLLNAADENKVDEYKKGAKSMVGLLWFLRSRLDNVTLSHLNSICIIQQNNLLIQTKSYSCVVCSMQIRAQSICLYVK